MSINCKGSFKMEKKLLRQRAREGHMFTRAAQGSERCRLQPPGSAFQLSHPSAADLEAPTESAKYEESGGGAWTRTTDLRIMRTQQGSAPLGKFCTLLLFPMGYKPFDLTCSAWK
jgi:hypothetical protein